MRLSFCMVVCGLSIACDRSTPEPTTPPVVPVAPNTRAEPPPEREPSDTLADPTPLLGGRIIARLPASVHADQVMQTREPMDVKLSASLHPFGTEEVPLAIAVMDLPRIAGPDLATGATAFLAQDQLPGEAPPEWTIASVETTAPIRAVLAVPNRLVRWGVPYDISVYAYGPAGEASQTSSVLFVALPEGGVVSIELECAEASCPRSRLEALARAIALTVSPGPTPLSRAAATRRATVFDLEVPADFAFDRLDGEDYVSVSLSPLVGLGDPAPPLLNVFEASSLPPTQENLGRPATQRGRVLGRSARYTVTTSDAGMTWTHECYLEGALYVFTLRARDEAAIAPMAAIVARARIGDEDIAPGTICEPYDPCPGNRYTEIVTRHPSDATIPLRAAPSSSAEITGSLEVSVDVTIAERRDGFVHVRTPIDGWAEAANLVGLCE